MNNQEERVFVLEGSYKDEEGRHVKIRKEKFYKSGIA
jgi:hypothetical protein